MQSPVPVMDGTNLRHRGSGSLIGVKITAVLVISYAMSLRQSSVSTGGPETTPGRAGIPILGASLRC